MSANFSTNSQPFATSSQPTAQVASSSSSAGQLTPNATQPTSPPVTPSNTARLATRFRKRGLIDRQARVSQDAPLLKLPQTAAIKEKVQAHMSQRIRCVARIYPLVRIETSASQVSKRVWRLIPADNKIAISAEGGLVRDALDQPQLALALTPWGLTSYEEQLLPNSRERIPDLDINIHVRDAKQLRPTLVKAASQLFQLPYQLTERLGFQDIVSVGGAGNNIFQLVKLGDGVGRDIELKLWSSLDLRSMFTISSFGCQWDPEREQARLFYSVASNPSQALLDWTLRELRAEHPEKINAAGWPRYLSLLCCGYTSQQAELEPTLWETFAGQLNDSATHLLQLLNCVDGHFPGEEAFALAYLLQSTLARPAQSQSLWSPKTWELALARHWDHQMRYGKNPNLGIINKLDKQLLGTPHTFLGHVAQWMRSDPHAAEQLTAALQRHALTWMQRKVATSPFASVQFTEHLGQLHWQFTLKEGGCCFLLPVDLSHLSTDSKIPEKVLSALDLESWNVADVDPVPLCKELLEQEEELSARLALEIWGLRPERISEGLALLRTTSTKYPELPWRERFAILSGLDLPSSSLFADAEWIQLVLEQRDPNLVTVARSIWENLTIDLEEALPLLELWGSIDLETSLQMFQKYQHNLSSAPLGAAKQFCRYCRLAKEGAATPPIRYRLLQLCVPIALCEENSKVTDLARACLWLLSSLVEEAGVDDVELIWNTYGLLAAKLALHKIPKPHAKFLQRCLPLRSPLEIWPLLFEAQLVAHLNEDALFAGLESLAKQQSEPFTVITEALIKELYTRDLLGPAQQRLQECEDTWLKQRVAYDTESVIQVLSTSPFPKLPRWLEILHRTQDNQPYLVWRHWPAIQEALGDDPAPAEASQILAICLESLPASPRLMKPHGAAARRWMKERIVMNQSLSQARQLLDAISHWPVRAHQAIWETVCIPCIPDKPSAHELSFLAEQSTAFAAETSDAAIRSRLLRVAFMSQDDDWITKLLSVWAGTWSEAPDSECCDQLLTWYRSAVEDVALSERRFTLLEQSQVLRNLGEHPLLWDRAKAAAASRDWKRLHAHFLTARTLDTTDERFAQMQKDLYELAADQAPKETLLELLHLLCEIDKESWLPIYQEQLLSHLSSNAYRSWYGPFQAFASAYPLEEFPDFLQAAITQMCAKTVDPAKLEFALALHDKYPQILQDSLWDTQLQLLDLYLSKAKLQSAEALIVKLAKNGDKAQRVALVSRHRTWLDRWLLKVSRNQLCEQYPETVQFSFSLLPELDARLKVLTSVLLRLAQLRAEDLLSHYHTLCELAGAELHVPKDAPSFRVQAALHQLHCLARHAQAGEIPELSSMVQAVYETSDIGKEKPLAKKLWKEWINRLQQLRPELSENKSAYKALVEQTLNLDTVLRPLHVGNLRLPLLYLLQPCEDVSDLLLARRAELLAMLRKEEATSELGTHLLLDYFDRILRTDKAWLRGTAVPLAQRMLTDRAGKRKSTQAAAGKLLEIIRNCDARSHPERAAPSLTILCHLVATSGQLPIDLTRAITRESAELLLHTILTQGHGSEAYTETYAYYAQIFSDHAKSSCAVVPALAAAATSFVHAALQAAPNHPGEVGDLMLAVCEHVNLLSTRSHKQPVALLLNPAMEVLDASGVLKDESHPQRPVLLVHAAELMRQAALSGVYEVDHRTGVSSDYCKHFSFIHGFAPEHPVRGRKKDLLSIHEECWGALCDRAAKESNPKIDTEMLGMLHKLFNEPATTNRPTFDPSLSSLRLYLDRRIRSSKDQKTALHLRVALLAILLKGVEGSYEEADPKLFRPIYEELTGKRINRPLNSTPLRAQALLPIYSMIIALDSLSCVPDSLLAAPFQHLHNSLGTLLRYAPDATREILDAALIRCALADFEKFRAIGRRLSHQAVQLRIYQNNGDLSCILNRTTLLEITSKELMVEIDPAGATQACSSLSQTLLERFPLHSNRFRLAASVFTTVLHAMELRQIPIDWLTDELERLIEASPKAEEEFFPCDMRSAHESLNKVFHFLIHKKGVTDRAHRVAILERYYLFLFTHYLPSDDRMQKFLPKDCAQVVVYSEKMLAAVGATLRTLVSCGWIDSEDPVWRDSLREAQERIDRHFQSTPAIAASSSSAAK